MESSRSGSHFNPQAPNSTGPRIRAWAGFFARSGVGDSLGGRGADSVDRNPSHLGPGRSPTDTRNRRHREGRSASAVSPYQRAGQKTAYSINSVSSQLTIFSHCRSKSFPVEYAILNKSHCDTACFSQSSIQAQRFSRCFLLRSDAQDGVFDDPRYEHEFSGWSRRYCYREKSPGSRLGLTPSRERGDFADFVDQSLEAERPPRIYETNPRPPPVTQNYETNPRLA